MSRDIPLIGEDLNSDMNHRVDSGNQALRRVAARMRSSAFPCTTALVMLHHGVCNDGKHFWHSPASPPGY